MPFDEDENKLKSVSGWRKVLKFALPSMVMMLLISTYTLVDGAFVSNLINTDALASINILMPISSLVTGMGFMFAAGGSAYVSNLMGKGENDAARRSFSQIMLTATVLSVILMIVGLLFMGPLVRLLGADDTLAPGSYDYGMAYVLFLPFLVLQFLTNQFLIANGKPALSLGLSVAGGLTNIALDYCLIGIAGMGMTGAALASGIGSLVPSVIGLVIFMNKKEQLHFTMPSKESKVIVSTCSNGISEMVSELSGGVVILLFNLTMMKFIGPDGVSAITILMYVQFLAMAVVIGYSNGIAPVMSFRHGADERDEMRDLLRISASFVAAVSLVIFLMIELFAEFVVGVFASESPEVMDIAVHGGRIFAFAFLLMGLNMYASSFFTSLSNGKVSAVISIMRSLVLLAPLIIILPEIFGIEAVWYTVPITELLSFILSLYFIFRCEPQYGYLTGNVKQAVEN